MGWCTWPPQEMPSLDTHRPEWRAVTAAARRLATMVGRFTTPFHEPVARRKTAGERCLCGGGWVMTSESTGETDRHRHESGVQAQPRMAIGPVPRHLYAGWSARRSRGPDAIATRVGRVAVGRLSSKQPPGWLARKGCPSGWRPGRLPCQQAAVVRKPMELRCRRPQARLLPVGGFSRPSVVSQDAIGIDRLGVLDYGEVGRRWSPIGPWAAGSRIQRDGCPARSALHGAW
jgi:hypothetical protein